MAEHSTVGSPFRAELFPSGQEHYRVLYRRQLLRLLLTYLAPMLVVIIYFGFQNHWLEQESRRLHLTAIAEHQANTLNLFLRERVVNLRNLIHSPAFLDSQSSNLMAVFLEDLVRVSDTFVDIGCFSEEGVQIAYAGPYPSLEHRDYGSEDWFQSLKSKADDFIITDIYLGFRQRPHFTIAVRRSVANRQYILRATLDPERIYAYIRSLEGDGEVFLSIVNTVGAYQLVTPHIGTLLERSSIVPPTEPRMGTQEIDLEGEAIFYAYTWLRMADWALIVQSAREGPYDLLSGSNLYLALVTTPLVLLITLAAFNRASKLVELQREADRTQAQLEHASKLASVGELAAGIAHEINNPLAVINEEAGLIKDLMNPEFGEPTPPQKLIPYLNTIEESVLRCRDITHKLLAFVRKTNIELRPIQVEAVIDEVVDGLLAHELAVSNIHIHKRYSPAPLEISTDPNQLQQVMLNLLNNAVDALEGRPGTITIRTERGRKRVRISVTDTGKGMSEEQIGKIFLPFYTTKEVGKGTGLGLSVSYGIIKGLGGEIEVESRKGVGSTFTIILPAETLV
ncbi:MAG: ATP-binding protein [Acidobacteriota bacterium]|nr:MAG: ATP-binding protein [Acidobacteriota bacterium]